jgi:hypothetical protein
LIKRRSLVASEAQEQEALFEIAETNPITKEYLFATVHETKVHPFQGKKYKDRGKKPGIPDICLPYPVGNFHACYIELKRIDKTNHATCAQMNWIQKLRKAGNYANVAYGWEDAWRQINNYLQNKNIPYEINIANKITVDNS